MLNCCLTADITVTLFLLSFQLLASSSTTTAASVPPSASPAKPNVHAHSSHAKQLGSACNPNSAHSECGRYAHCFAVPKCSAPAFNPPSPDPPSEAASSVPLSMPSSSSSIGICLCLDGYRQVAPSKLSPSLLPVILPIPLILFPPSSPVEQIIAANSSGNGSTKESFDESDYHQETTAWTDCQPVARLGQRCQPGLIPLTYDGRHKLVLPEGSICDVRSATVRCNQATIEDNGQCVDSLGRQSYGELCTENQASPTSCDVSKRLACMPDRQSKRTCQCSPGFVWKDNSSCTLVGIGDECEHSFDCNMAQYRGHTWRRDSTATSIAYCDLTGSRRCECNQTAGYLPVTIVQPNAYVAIRRRRSQEDTTTDDDELYDNINFPNTRKRNKKISSTFFLYRVDLTNFSKRKNKLSSLLNEPPPPLWETETRCIAKDFISSVGGCGDRCSMDLDVASSIHRLAVCAEGLVCHQCPSMDHPRCVRVADPEQNDFLCAVHMMPPWTVRMWLTGFGVAGGLLLLTLTAVVAFFAVKRQQRRQQHQLNRKIADDNNGSSNILATEVAASVSLLDSGASSSQVPQVWATFRITPWKT